MSRIERILRGQRLITAEIFYHRPDYPLLLQTFVWQEYDLVPRFPILNGFLKFWQSTLDGKLHSVRVASSGIAKPIELKIVGSQFTLH